MSNTVYLHDHQARCGNCGEPIHLVRNELLNPALKIYRLVDVYWGHSERGGHRHCPVSSDASKRCPTGEKFTRFKVGRYSLTATVGNKAGNEFIEPWLRPGFDLEEEVA